MKEKDRKSLPLVAPIHPLKGHHSKAVLGATLSCYAVHRPSELSAAVRLTSQCKSPLFASAALPLLNRITLGAGRPTNPQCLTEKSSATGPFHGLFPSVRFRTAPKSRDKYQNNSSARWLEHLAA